MAFTRIILFLIGWGLAPALATWANLPSTVATAMAQDPLEQLTSGQSPAAGGISLGTPVRHRWQVGVKIMTGSAALRDMRVTIPVPTNWPEQAVVKASENVPNLAREVDIRTLNNGLQQIVATFRTIPPDTPVELSMTFDVTLAEVIPPDNPQQFSIPKTVPKEIREYLGVSPQISGRNAKLRAQVKKLVREKTTGWEQVEAIYDWVRDNIQNRDQEPTDTLGVFRDKAGCGEDIVGLFVAMCRAQKVPARMVWVDGSQQAEFYLVDGEKKGHWFPCNVVGLREFGGISDPRVILQKGDNFEVPEKKERQKFVAEYAKGSGRKKPRVQFFRKLLPAE